MDATRPRKFITRLDIENAAETRSVISLGPRDVITDEAAQRARDLAVEVTRDASPNPASSATRTRPDPSLRSIVKAAVIAELGTEPPGLESALDTVFNAEKFPSNR